MITDVQIKTWKSAMDPPFQGTRDMPGVREQADQTALHQEDQFRYGAESVQILF